MIGKAKKIVIYWKSEDKIASEYQGVTTFKYTDFNTLNIVVGKDLYIIERHQISEVIFENFSEINF